MTNFFARIGRYTIQCINTLGQVVVFTADSTASALLKPFYIEIIWRHILEFAFFPLSTVALVSLFIGAALVMQVGSSPYYSSSTSLLVAPIVSTSVIRELGPTLIALIMAGRLGSSYAAEISTMKMTEQIDALVMLKTNPVKYLFTPRIIAGVISMPFLTIVSIVIGIYGGYLAATMTLNINNIEYMYSTFQSIKKTDFITGMLKSVVYGFTIPLMGCYHGYYCVSGERGVGIAATSSVLSSSVLIILLNYFLTVSMHGV